MRVNSHRINLMARAIFTGPKKMVKTMLLMKGNGSMEDKMGKEN